MVDIDGILKEFSAVKAKRAPYEPIWELIAKFMYQRKQGFTITNAPGAFYTSADVFDNTAGNFLQRMISSIDGALWKNGARTFQVRIPRQIKNVPTSVKEFYGEINARISEQMEHEKAAFGTARQEALAEGSAFGTDGIGVFAAPEGSEHKVEYRSMTLKKLYVVEDARGRVIKEFYEDELTASQLVGEYGDAAMTEKVKALLETNNHETKMTVLLVIRPRAEVNSESAGVERFSYESVHILVGEKIVLRESGYQGNPIIVSRFYKNEGEEYGRSAGFNALNAVTELNALIEIITKGSEVAYLPPWYVLDDGTFGNGVIDRSAGAVVPIDVTSSRISGMAPIGQIGTVGDMTPAMKLAELLIEEIKGHFLVDQLTDLNNKTRMTLGEAQIRNELRSDSTGAIFSRQMDEKLLPVIRRTISILEEAGELGVVPGTEMEKMVLASGRKPLYIPDEVLELAGDGIEIYPIKFISPAARILRAEELRGVISTWQFAAGFSAVAPELMIRINKKRSLEIINDLYGAPDDILLSEDDFQKEMKSYNDAQQARMQMQAAQVQADVKVKEASANQQNAQAEATMGGMNGLLNGGGAGSAFAPMVM